MLFTIALLLILPGHVADPTLDELKSRYAAEKKAAEGATKTAAATAAELVARLAAFQKELVELGLLGPTPDPKPPDPKPVDTLAVKLKSAYDADTGPEKKADALYLATLYHAATDLAADKSVTTTTELIGQVRKAAATLLKDHADGTRLLEGVRNVIAAEWVKTLGKDDEALPLTEARRKAASDLFTKLATILEGF